MHDRIDEIVGFTLPTIDERRTILYHYLVKYCQPPSSALEKAKFLYKHPRSIYTGKKLIKMEGVNHDIINEMATLSDGFSGRELHKMVVAWHDAAFTMPTAVLTPEIMNRIIAKF